MLHPQLEIAEFGDDRIDLHGHGLARPKAFDRRQIDLQQTGLLQLTFGICKNLPRPCRCTTGREETEPAGCPVISPNSWPSISNSEPSSIPCGTTQALTGGLKPGTAGIDVSRPI